MDQSWKNASCMSPAYEEGVEDFLQFASKRSRLDEDEKYFCLCINYLNERRQVLVTYENIFCVMKLRRIIRHGYGMVNTNMQKGSQTEPIDIKMGDPLEDIIRDLGRVF